MLINVLLELLLVPVISLYLLFFFVVFESSYRSINVIFNAVVLYFLLLFDAFLVNIIFRM